MKSYGLYIGGSFRPSAAGTSFTDYASAGGEALAEIASAGREDIDEAVCSAKAVEQVWRRISPAERAEILLKTAQRIEENCEELARTESRDSGRVIIETREDVAAAADLFRYFAGTIRNEEDSIRRHDDASFSMIVREPYGTVGLIVPWNFPFLIACWKMAPALAAGNCLILKPSTKTPLSVLLFAELVGELYPAGVLNITPGPGSVCGDAITDHPGIAKLSFTGSSEVGRSIAQKAGGRILPVSLELGGKSANIIFPDAPMEKALEAACIAILYSQGQVCCAGSRLLLHSAIHDSFLEQLKVRFSRIRIGDPLDNTSRMGPLIDRQQRESVLSYVEIGKKEGARLVCGGKAYTQEGLPEAAYMEPTIFCDVQQEMRIAREEIFGPVLAVSSFEEEADAIAQANDSEYGLAGAVWTKDINRAFRMASALEAGTVWINEYNAVPSGSPFGGYKSSGYGREVHKMALENYSRTKTIYIQNNEDPFSWYE